MDTADVKALPVISKLPYVSHRAPGMKDLTCLPLQHIKMSADAYASSDSGAMDTTTRNMTNCTYATTDKAPTLSGKVIRKMRTIDNSNGALQAFKQVASKFNENTEPFDDEVTGITTKAAAQRSVQVRIDDQRQSIQQQKQFVRAPNSVATKLDMSKVTIDDSQPVKVIPGTRHLKLRLQ